MVRRSRRTRNEPPEIIPPKSDEEPDAQDEGDNKGQPSGTDDDSSEIASGDDEESEEIISSGAVSSGRGPKRGQKPISGRGRGQGVGGTSATGEAPAASGNPLTSKKARREATAANQKYSGGIKMTSKDLEDRDTGEDPPKAALGEGTPSPVLRAGVAADKAEINRGSNAGGIAGEKRGGRKPDPLKLLSRANPGKAKKLVSDQAATSTTGADTASATGEEAEPQKQGSLNGKGRIETTNEPKKRPGRKRKLSAKAAEATPGPYGGAAESVGESRTTGKNSDDGKSLEVFESEAKKSKRGSFKSDFRSSSESPRPIARHNLSKGGSWDTGDENKRIPLLGDVVGATKNNPVKLGGKKTPVEVETKKTSAAESRVSDKSNLLSSTLTSDSAPTNAGLSATSSIPNKGDDDLLIQGGTSTLKKEKRLDHNSTRPKSNDENTSVVVHQVTAGVKQNQGSPKGRSALPVAVMEDKTQKGFQPNEDVMIVGVHKHRSAPGKDILTEKLKSKRVSGGEIEEGSTSALKAADTTKEDDVAQSMSQPQPSTSTSVTNKIKHSAQRLGLDTTKELSKSTTGGEEKNLVSNEGVNSTKGNKPKIHATIVDMDASQGGTTGKKKVVPIDKARSVEASSTGKQTSVEQHTADTQPSRAKAAAPNVSDDSQGPRGSTFKAFQYGANLSVGIVSQNNAGLPRQSHHSEDDDNGGKGSIHENSGNREWLESTARHESLPRASRQQQGAKHEAEIKESSNKDAVLTEARTSKQTAEPPQLTGRDDGIKGGGMEDEESNAAGKGATTSNKEFTNRHLDRLKDHNNAEPVQAEVDVKNATQGLVATKPPDENDVQKSEKVNFANVESGDIPSSRKVSKTERTYTLQKFSRDNKDTDSSKVGVGDPADATQGSIGVAAAYVSSVAESIVATRLPPKSEVDEVAEPKVGILHKPETQRLSPGMPTGIALPNQIIESTEASNPALPAKTSKETDARLDPYRLIEGRNDDGRTSFSTDENQMTVEEASIEATPSSTDHTLLARKKIVYQDNLNSTSRPIPASTENRSMEAESAGLKPTKQMLQDRGDVNITNRSDVTNASEFKAATRVRDAEEMNADSMSRIAGCDVVDNPRDTSKTGLLQLNDIQAQAGLLVSSSNHSENEMKESLIVSNTVVHVGPSVLDSNRQAANAQIVEPKGGIPREHPTKPVKGKESEVLSLRHEVTATTSKTAYGILSREPTITVADNQSQNEVGRDECSSNTLEHQPREIDGRDRSGHADGYDGATEFGAEKNILSKERLGNEDRKPTDRVPEDTGILKHEAPRPEKKAKCDSSDTADKISTFQANDNSASSHDSSGIKSTEPSANDTKTSGEEDIDPMRLQFTLNEQKSAIQTRTDAACDKSTVEFSNGDGRDNLLPLPITQHPALKVLPLGSDEVATERVEMAAKAKMENPPTFVEHPKMQDATSAVVIPWDSTATNPDVDNKVVAHEISVGSLTHRVTTVKSNIALHVEKDERSDRSAIDVARPVSSSLLAAQAAQYMDVSDPTKDLITVNDGLGRQSMNSRAHNGREDGIELPRAVDVANRNRVDRNQPTKSETSSGGDLELPSFESNTNLQAIGRIKPSGKGTGMVDASAETEATKKEDGSSNEKDSTKSPLISVSVNSRPPRTPADTYTAAYSTSKTNETLGNSIEQSSGVPKDTLENRKRNLDEAISGYNNVVSVVGDEIGVVSSPVGKKQRIVWVSLSRSRSKVIEGDEISAVYAYDENKVSRVKMLLFKAGSRVHRGRGFERLFSTYWDAVCLRLSDRLSSHTSERCDEAIGSFLTTRKLRQMHNRFIMCKCDCTRWLFSLTPISNSNMSIDTANSHNEACN